MSNKQNISKIRLGICMAGAVSAGAYTAGVLDYLFEALDRWERLKKEAREENENIPGKGVRRQIPMHDVEIVILAGASAGGMTAAIAARALQGEPSENLLYESWVKLAGQDPIKQMLDIDDLKGKRKEVLSLLNSSFLDVLGKKILESAHSTSLPRRPYVNQDLEVLMTLSNLSGVTTKVPFRSTGGPTTATFDAKQHRDFAHFVIGKDSALGNKGRIPVGFSERTNLPLFSSAALATGAFPVVLKPRILERPLACLKKNSLLMDLLGDHFQLIPNDSMPDATYSTLNVDGGMLNNEPFDIVDKVMKSRFSKDEENVLNVLLLIDPFPSEEEEEKQQPEKSDVISVARRLISVFRQQNMVKPDYMKAKQKGAEDYRFIMIPSKDQENGQEINGSRALASAALEGFAGFLYEPFRQHDFMLGRINCKSFLQQYFVVPQEHFPTPGFAPRFKEKNKKQETPNEGMVVVIPDLDSEAGGFIKFEQKEENCTDFPSYDLKNLKKLKKGFGKRVRYILGSLIRPEKWFIRLIFNLLGKCILKKIIWGQVKKTITKEFEEWGLVEKKGASK